MPTMPTTPTQDRSRNYAFGWAPGSWCVAIFATWVGLLAPGCQPGPPDPYDYSGVPINFKDQVQTNATVEEDDLNLTFIDTKGNKVAIGDFRGKKNVVLVFTRGFPGQICPFCTAQTSRLLATYPEFTRRNAEVLAVFPGQKSRVSDFLKAVHAQNTAGPAEPPFPVLLDEELAAVDRLGIRGDLAKPSTYILDKQGRVRFAYVGAHVSDRPSIKALLQELDSIEREQAPDSASP